MSWTFLGGAKGRWYYWGSVRKTLSSTKEMLKDVHNVGFFKGHWIALGNSIRYWIIFKQWGMMETMKKH
jgi:hypothetical protein